MAIVYSTINRAELRILQGIRLIVREVYKTSAAVEIISSLATLVR